MAFQKICVVPIILVFLLNATVSLTIIMAWTLRHVTYLVPYISDAGTYPPESCIFGQALNIISFLLLVVVYVKYRQSKEIISKYNVDVDLRIANISKWLGCSAALGCSLVANFQETNVLCVHWIGAILSFGNGSMYMVIESIISHKVYPVYGDRVRNVIKFCISVVALIASFGFIVGAFISIPNFKGADMTKWKQEDGYLVVHSCSAVCEWICAACTSLFILLLSCDFRDITISEPIVTCTGKFTLPKQLERRYY